MGMIPAAERPRYDKARVEAREIYVKNPNLTTPQIVGILKERGWEFAKIVTVKAWKRQDLWPKRLKAAVDEFDMTAKVLLAHPLSRSRPTAMHMTGDRLEQIERFHEASIIAGMTLASKMTGWANKLDTGKMTVEQGVQVMRELPPFLEAMAKHQMLIADAKHHMPTISPAPGQSRPAPMTIDGESQRMTGIGAAVVDILADGAPA